MENKSQVRLRFCQSIILTVASTGAYVLKVLETSLRRPTARITSEPKYVLVGQVQILEHSARKLKQVRWASITVPRGKSSPRPREARHQLTISGAAFVQEPSNQVNCCAAGTVDPYYPLVIFHGSSGTFLVI